MTTPPDTPPATTTVGTASAAADVEASAADDVEASAADDVEEAAPPGPPPEVALPPLGTRGWLRWGWRQLTSMRTALLLLLLLAVAAVPGSVFPQRRIDPGAVEIYLADHPAAGPVLDRLGFFDVYASPWFSAIYLLLF